MQGRENAHTALKARGGGLPAGDLRSAVSWSWLTNCAISSQLRCSDVAGSLKLDIVGVFTPQKSAHDPDQGFFCSGDPSVKHLQHTTGMDEWLFAGGRGIGKHPRQKGLHKQRHRSEKEPSDGE